MMDEEMKQQAKELLYDLTHVDNDWECCVDRPDAVTQIEKALRAAYADGLDAAAKDLNERVENCFKILSDGRVLTNKESGEWRARMELLKSLREQLWQQAKQIHQQAKEMGHE